MALVKCKECGQKISSKAAACPNCGAKPPKRTSLLTWIILGFFAFMVYVPLKTTLNRTPEQRKAAYEMQKEASAKEAKADAKRAERVKDEGKKIAWIERGKDAVRNRLKDPGSATFKDVVFVKGADGIPMVCGSVNSKNSYGGFVGFQNFVSAGSDTNTFLQNEVKDFATIWNRFCVK